MNLLFNELFEKTFEHLSFFDGIILMNLSLNLLVY